MKQLLVIFTCLCTLMPAGAQDVLTLEECLRLGIENNLSLKSSRNEVRKGEHTLSENRAKLLPQINAVAGFNDNFNPPVSVTDGSAYGNPYNVTKTLQYNASAGIQLQMPLYNQTVYTAMDITRTMNELNRLSYEKAREDLILQICKMYYLSQNTSEQLALIKENISRLNELSNITQAFYDNGMAMEVDVKRVNINLENQRVQYDNAQSMLTQQLNLLKYVMDYPADKEIALTPVHTENITSVSLTGLDNNQYELQLLQSKQKLAEQQRKMIGQGYIPSLSLTGNWMYSAYTDKAKNWFHSGPSNHWYQSSGIGLTLRIPIFDGLEKRAKMRKAKIEVENTRLSYENALKNMQTQYLNATNELRMSEAQNNYINAHYNYQVTNLTLLKLTGQLETLFNGNSVH